MPTIPLPDEPSLEHLRNQARDLQRALAAGDPAALGLAAEHHPAGPQAPGSLSAAQLIVARQYEFGSWPRLRQHVETVQRYSRFPARMDQTAAGDTAADAFLRLACLTYEDTGPEQWRQAGVRLRGQPGLTRGSAPAAAAAADTEELAAILAADPGAARREAGPYRWEPLFYLAYARHDPDISRDAVLEAARRLLAAGADPNAGYLWHGLPTPFTVLTGVFGEGERGPELQPRHPHAQALARLLLAAGAHPNDGQALYNRMFEPGNDHLELLLEFGLGTGDGGPWRRRLGGAAGTGTPEEEMRGQLGWAIAHGMTGRVRLLVEHGADFTTPGDDGVSPAELAATTGHPDIAADLVARGAPAPDLDPPAAFAAAALAGDAEQARRLQAAHPALAGDVRRARPALIVWAAAEGRPGAVEILAAAGWDVNVKGRTDVPSDTEWQTALHAAAQAGDVALARTLLDLGADPDIRDHRFGGTPLGWARYFGQDQLIELLEPVTAPDDPPPPTRT
jgi:hypothetical protein